MKRQRLILRLDDAADRMDIKKWEKMEQLLDKYSIKPLVGVIPDCKDPNMMKYEKDPLFWDKVHKWIDKGWIIAMHGYQHVYDSHNGGINPVNQRSEFAGHSLDVQRIKIRKGYHILKDHDIDARIFFAPGHTFDGNTIEALLNETDIKTISDTISRDVYIKNGIKYIPVQSGSVRKMPFKTVTYCYHPNTLEEEGVRFLESFLIDYRSRFISAADIDDLSRRYGLVDKILSYVYFVRRRCM